MHSEQRTDHPTGRAGLRRAGALLAGAFLVPALLTACSDVLEVEDPDIVPPENLDSPAGLEARRVGAFGDFAFAYSGAGVGGGGLEGQIMASGLFADEFHHSGTFPTRIEFDARKIQDDNSTLEDYYSLQHMARRAAESTADAYLAADFIEESEKDVPVAEMNNLAGFTYVFFGENFCSGVPFSRVLDDGSFEFGQPLTTEQMFEEAIARFDEALARAEAGGSADLALLARVGKARALLNLGRFDEAAAEAAEVPDDFAYEVRYSGNSDRQENGVYVLNVEFERWAVANAEAGNGLDYRDRFTAGDPRTPWTRTPEDDMGFDTSVEQYDQLKYADEPTDIPLATGLETRLIEAEAALRSGDVAGWKAIHDDLRAEAGLGPLETGGLSDDELVDLHFEERALWLWLTGHRMGDLRRLIRQYDRTEDEVFPTGDYFKTQAGDYGDDVNFPVPFDEENNPNFDSCLNRNA